MSFGAHLLELRKRVYISAAAIVAGMIGGWFLSDFLLQAIRQPIFDVA